MDAPSSPSPSAAQPSPSSLSAPLIRYDCSSPLTCLSYSPHLHLVAVGGKELRLLSLLPHALFPLPRPPTSSSSLQSTSISDLSFHPSAHTPELLLSAPTTGVVHLYSLHTRDGLKRPLRVFEEHSRAVHRVLWSRVDPDLFFSGGQDGLVKLWDARDDRRQSRLSLVEDSSVRDLSLHPANGWQLAAGYDNGNIVVWDTRVASAALSASPRVLTISAHAGLCLSLDWHPVAGELLASGGIDRAIRVWDVTSLTSASHDAAVHALPTMGGVSKVAWRPGRDGQLASCSSLMDYDVHVWNVHTPYIPLATLSHHRGVVTGLHFMAQGDDLLTCSKDGVVQLFPLADAHAPYAHLTTVAVDWAVTGELAAVEDTMATRASVVGQRAPPLVFPMQFQAAAGKGRHGWVHVHDVQKELCARDPTAGVGRMTDVECLVHCARRYRMTGAGVSELCAWNAQVAGECGRVELVHIWEMVRLLWGDEPTPATAPSPPSALGLADDTPVKGASATTTRSSSRTHSSASTRTTVGQRSTPPLRTARLCPLSLGAMFGRASVQRRLRRRWRRASRAWSTSPTSCCRPPQPPPSCVRLSEGRWGRGGTWRPPL